MTSAFREIPPKGQFFPYSFEKRMSVASIDLESNLAIVHDRSHLLTLCLSSTPSLTNSCRLGRFFGLESESVECN